MRNIILILMLGVIFSGFIQAEEVIQSTVTAKKELKLQWKKTFDGEIKNFVPSENGNYIAVSVDKSELKDKFSGINFLDREGNVIWQKNLKYDWKIRGIVDKSTSAIIVPKGPQRGVKIYDKQGKIKWDSKGKWGLPIISPNGKYIAMVDDGVAEGTPNIRVYDTEGNKLWNHDPKVFPSNAFFINDEFLAVVKVPFIRKEHEMRNGKSDVISTKAYPGEVVLFRAVDGKKVWKTTYKYDMRVGQILKLEYDIAKNEIKVFLDSYPKNGVVNIPLKAEAIKQSALSVDKKSQWSNGWPIETDASVIEINKADKKELLFYQKTE